MEAIVGNNDRVVSVVEKRVGSKKKKNISVKVIH